MLGREGWRRAASLVAISKESAILFSHSDTWVRRVISVLPLPSRLAKTLNPSRRIGDLMSGNKSYPVLTPPEIISLGSKWPAAEETIRKLGRDHGVPAEVIESFLDAIKAARRKKEEHENRTPPFSK